MGRIARLLAFTRVTKDGAKQTDVKLDPGAGFNITARGFSAPGDDSQPLPGDYVATTTVPQSGGHAAVAYLDPDSEAVSGPGEVRRYSRDSEGTVMAAYHLKADGTVVVTNPAGENTFNPDGSISFANGATMDASGDYITAAGISLNNHKHIGNMGSPVGPAY